MSPEQQSWPARAMFLGQVLVEDKRNWVGPAGRNAFLRPRAWNTGRIVSPPYSERRAGRTAQLLRSIPAAAFLGPIA